MIVREIDRPSAVPPTRRLDAENGSKMRSRSSGAIGSPELCTDTPTASSDSGGPNTWTSITPLAGANRIAFVEQVAEHLREPLGVADDRDVLGRRAEHDRELLRRRGAAIAIDHLAREPIELDRRRGDRDRAGLRAREVEQLVDELVHARRGLARHVDVAQLAIR